MRKTLEQFSAGNAGARIEDPGQDEIGELSRSFDSMADTISSQMKQIQEQDSLRRELVQNICHDLRTPLTAALGYVETMEARDAHLEKVERLKYLNIVGDNLKFIQSMADELFELSTLEAGERKLDLKPFELNSLCEALCAKFEEFASSKKIKLSSLSETNDVWVTGDVGMISRALSNLMENAIRYTPNHGQVLAGADLEQDSIRVWIRDSGVGVAEEDREKIFSRFYRAANGRKIHAKGSGLGLPIVQRIVELHGSSVTVESVVGEGSRFSFLLSQATAPR